ncbi:BPSS1780 family membrane protein [Dongshaea marina]|uniref:BPSS1780 family membrane protein n=1 Tax=Dongshaea marina TaxID=2047966 RepID=UPI000D3E7811|nr:BPSS1780 family membrane protein [Dongshaea marina]
MKQWGMKGFGASHGLKWIGRSWGYFRMAPLVWISLLMLYMILVFFISRLPLSVDLLLLEILGFALMGFFVIGCRCCDHGRPFNLSALFSALKPYWFSFLKLGILSFLFVLVAQEIWSLVGIDFSNGQQALLASIEKMGTEQNLMVILLVVVFALKSMLFYFAVPLVIFSRYSIGQIMLLSIQGCLKNWSALLAYNIVFGCVVAISSIPMGIGLLVTIPMVYMAQFAAYKDIFEVEQQEKPTQHKERDDVISA